MGSRFDSDARVSAPRLCISSVIFFESNICKIITAFPITFDSSCAREGVNVMHEHSHSNQRSKPHILARSPPTLLPPPLWPGPLVRFVLCTHIDSLWTGFRIARPSSIFLGVNYLVAHQGDSRRRGPHGRSFLPPTVFFLFSRPGRATLASGPRDRITVRCRRPPAACPPPPATPAFTYGLPHPRHWMYADVHAAISVGCPLMQPRDVQLPSRD